MEFAGVGLWSGSVRIAVRIRKDIETTHLLGEGLCTCPDEIGPDRLDKALTRELPYEPVDGCSRRRSLDLASIHETNELADDGSARGSFGEVGRAEEKAKDEDRLGDDGV